MKLTPTPATTSKARWLTRFSLALVVIGSWGAGAGAFPAAGANGPSKATVAITELTPAVPKPGQTLSLSGLVTNSGSSTIDDVLVRLRVGTTPLLGRSDVGAVASGTSNMQGQLVNVTSSDQPRRLDPGGQSLWHLSVPLADLPLGGAGVYVLVVEAVGTVNGTYSQLGLTRSFLPWVPIPSEVQRSQLVWLWPVSAPPTATANGILTSDSLASQFAPAGRLADLINVGATAAPGVVSWLVDPQVIESATALGKGYRFFNGQDLAEGTGATNAQAWSAAASAVLSTGDVHPLPYALPDADALVRAGLDHDVVASLTLGQSLLAKELGRGVGPALFWPQSGVSERGTLDVLQAAGVGNVVLSDSTLPTAVDQTYTSTGFAALPTTSGSLSALLIDSGLAQTLAMPTATPAEILAARQRFAAETAMVTFEDPGRPRTVVAAPALGWNPSPALLTQLLPLVADCPWITPATLSSLLSATVDTSQRGRVEYSAALRGRELSPRTINRLIGVHRNLTAIASLLGNPTSVTEPFTTAILRGESTWWRSDPETGNVLSTAIAKQLADVMSKARIVSHGTITLSGVNGSIPLTIANDFDQPITVAVILRSNPAPRLHTRASAAFTIPAHRKVSIEIPATLAGSAPLSVAAQLVTSSGVPVGAPINLALRSTAYARSAKYVVVLAFAALLILMAANFIKRRRAVVPA